MKMPSSAFALSKDTLWKSFWYFYFWSALVMSALLDLNVPNILRSQGNFGYKNRVQVNNFLKAVNSLGTLRVKVENSM